MWFVSYLSLLVGPALARVGDGEYMAGCGRDLRDAATPGRMLQPHCTPPPPLHNIFFRSRPLQHIYHHFLPQQSLNHLSILIFSKKIICMLNMCFFKPRRHLLAEKGRLRYCNTGYRTVPPVPKILWVAGIEPRIEARTLNMS